MTVSRWRLGLARALAAASALWWALPFFGLIDLLVVVIQDERFYEHYLLETGWGLLYLFLIVVPFLWLVARPAAGLPVVQLLVVGVAVAGAAALAGYPQQVLAALAIWLSGGLVGWVAGSRPGVPALRPDIPLVALTALAAPACVVYAWSQAHGWRPLGSDVTNGLDHRPMQAALGLAVLLVAALGAVAVGARRAAWRVPVWTVAVTVLWLGVESVVYPDHEGSLGTALGIAAAVWGVLFAGTAEVRVRRTPRP